MKLATIGHKGGIGKSTIAVMLSLALTEAGQKVTVVDFDPQGSASRALGLVGGNVVISAGNVPDDTDVTIYDTPPQLDHITTRLAVQSADLILVPVSPNLPDLWEADRTAVFCHETNPNARAFFLLNQMQGHTRLGRVVASTLSQLSLPLLDAHLSRRECFVHAMGLGWRALDNNARAEIIAVGAEVFKLYGKT